MMYTAKVTAVTCNAFGQGKTDHAALSDAISKIPGQWQTPCTIRIYQQYANKEVFLYSGTLTQYLENTK